MAEAPTPHPPDPLPGAGLSRLRVEHADDDARVVSAVDAAGEVVGIASAGTSSDPGAPTAWELYAVNTVAGVRGTGLADALLVDVLGDRPACVWVLVGNDRARGFYRRHGFRADGAQRTHEGSGAPEERMVRHRMPLAPHLAGDRHPRHASA